MERPFLLASRFYFSRLSEEDKKTYRMIYEHWMEGIPKVQITVPGRKFVLPSGLSISDLMSQIFMDNPQLFHLSNYQHYYQRYGDTVTLWVDMEYSMEEYHELNRRLNEVVDQIFADPRMQGGPDMRLQYLHDYLAETITYYGGDGSPRSDVEVHSIVGALLNHACVCAGYAKAFRLLCDLARVSCMYVRGMAGAAPENMEHHGWNMIRLKGKTYHVDVTWDADKPAQDKYLMRCDEAFWGKHTWDTKLYPECPEDAPFRQPILHGKQELKAWLNYEFQVRKKSRAIVRFPKNFGDQDRLGKVLSEVLSEDRSVIGGGSYRYFYDPQTQYGEVLI